MTFYGDLTPEPSREAGGGGMWGRLVPTPGNYCKTREAIAPCPNVRGHRKKVLTARRSLGGHRCSNCCSTDWDGRGLSWVSGTG